MRIGELARLCGLTVHAIRWYESQRLIPGVRRNASGHREYGEWHVSWLALLNRLKLTGMTIAQMAAYTSLVRKGEGTLAEQQRMFVQHREQAARHIQARQQALEHIDLKIDFLERWIRTGQRPAIAEPSAPKDGHAKANASRVRSAEAIPLRRERR